MKPKEEEKTLHLMGLEIGIRNKFVEKKRLFISFLLLSTLILI